MLRSLAFYPLLLIPVALYAVFAPAAPAQWEPSDSVRGALAGCLASADTTLSFTPDAWSLPSEQTNAAETMCSEESEAFVNECRFSADAKANALVYDTPRGYCARRRLPDAIHEITYSLRERSAVQ